MRIQGGYKNDLVGVVFDGLWPGDPKLNGEDVLKNMFGLSLDHSKWWDLFALYCLFLTYRVLFFVILKLKERTTPFFRSLYAKRTIHYLKRRPSFRRKPSFPSRRHYNLHSLSSQEGLSSPIPWMIKERVLEKCYFLVCKDLMVCSISSRVL